MARRRGGERSHRLAEDIASVALVGHKCDRQHRNRRDRRRPTPASRCPARALTPTASRPERQPRRAARSPASRRSRDSDRRLRRLSLATSLARSGSRGRYVTCAAALQIAETRDEATTLGVAVVPTQSRSPPPASWSRLAARAGRPYRGVAMARHRPCQASPMSSSETFGSWAPAATGRMLVGENLRRRSVGRYGQSGPEREPGLDVRIAVAVRPNPRVCAGCRRLARVGQCCPI
jgi:hypothetical protein